MSTKAWALEMALYNKWQNEKLFDLCARLDDAVRKLDRGMFFRTIHETLDHILMVDGVLWDFAVTGEPIQGFDPNRGLFEDYEALSRARRAFDDKMIEDIGTHPKVWLEETISFHHPRLGRRRTHTRQFPLMQLFNHATHHRSQVTAELHRLGIDYGSTDLPYNPLSQY